MDVVQRTGDLSGVQPREPAWEAPEGAVRDETGQRPAGNVLQGEDGVQLGREAVFEGDNEWMPSTGAERLLLR